MTTLTLEKQGETLIFFGEPDPDAEFVEFECHIAPGADGPDPHVHTLQTETFHVTAGRMCVTVDGVERVLEAGETVVVTPGQIHTFSNGSPTEPLKLSIRMEPALNFQWFLTEMARSAIRNGGSWKDVPLIEAGYILHQVSDENAYPGMPTWLQRLLGAVLTRAAILLKRTEHIAPRIAAETAPV